MSYATEKFEITAIVRDYPPSPNIGDDRREPVGFVSVDARCKLCGAAWTATESRRDEPGKFRSYVGQMKLFCRACPNNEVISLMELIRVFPEEEQ